MCKGEIMDWNKFWELYHKGWGQAKVSSEYDKRVFSDMQAMLLHMQNGRDSDGVKMVIISERRKTNRRRQCV